MEGWWKGGGRSVEGRWTVIGRSWKVLEGGAAVGAAYVECICVMDAVMSTWCGVHGRRWSGCAQNWRVPVSEGTCMHALGAAHRMHANSATVHEGAG